MTNITSKDNDEVVLKGQVPPCTTLWKSLKSIKLPVDCNDGPWRSKKSFASSPYIRYMDEMRGLDLAL
jgi:hypothetical protein